MLRIILWRLFFDLKNLCKLFVRSDKTYKYFAYGGNLDPGVLRRRKIEILSEQDYVLKDHELRFNVPGEYEGMGYASAEFSKGEEIYGRIYELSKIDAERMDYYEASAFLGVYRRVVQPYGADELFFYQAVNPKENLKPTTAYLNYIIVAYSTSKSVPEGVLANLRSMEAVETKEIAKRANVFVQDYDILGERFAKFLVLYEAFCIVLFERFFYRFSLTEWLIKKPQV